MGIWLTTITIKICAFRNTTQVTLVQEAFATIQIYSPTKFTYARRNIKIICKIKIFTIFPILKDYFFIYKEFGLIINNTIYKNNQMMKLNLKSFLFSIISIISIFASTNVAFEP